MPLTKTSMEAPMWMFTKALSHRQKVLRLYKRALREVDAWFSGGGFEKFLEARYQKVIMRARFEAYKDEKDQRKAALLLADGCRQLWEKKHPHPTSFAHEPYGSDFDRFVQMDDQLLDDYPGPEREQFPYYFNRREQRKKELLEHWSKIEKAWDDEVAAIQTELPKEAEENVKKVDNK